MKNLSIRVERAIAKRSRRWTIFNNGLCNLQKILCEKSKKTNKQTNKKQNKNNKNKNKTKTKTKTKSSIWNGHCMLIKLINKIKLEKKSSLNMQGMAYNHRAWYEHTVRNMVWCLCGMQNTRQSNLSKEAKGNQSLSSAFSKGLVTSYLDNNMK